MSGESPNVGVEDMLLMLTVNVNGSAIADTIQIESAFVSHEVNRISYAEIILIGPDSPEMGDAPTSDGTDFNPGNSIEILAGYGGGTEQSVFKGVIVKHGLEIDDSSIFKIRLLCKHVAVSMTYNRNEAMFENKKDSDIISSITGTYTGLTASVDSTSSTQEYVFQKLATDWDFIMSRAQFNGFVITMDGDSLTIGAPKFSGSPALSVSLIDTVVSMEVELSAERQPTAVQTSAWDIKNQSLLTGSSTEPSLNEQGNVTAKSLSSQLGQSQLNYTSLTPMVQEDLNTWANSLLLKSRMSALKGSITFTGSALAKTGTLITLSGIGSKFNGDAYITGVVHTFENSIWRTTVKFGLDAIPFFEKEIISYPRATGQIPAISGLQIATVIKLSSDPQSQFRIQINIPTSASSSTSVWARYSNFYATSGAGAFFMPEVGDEVLIGFIDDDPRFPVILGSLYSNAKASPVSVSDDNNYTKSLTTKANLILGFDDNKKVITIQTPGGNSIVISDDAKGITIADQNSNTIKMSSSGIELNSNKDINLTASGDIKLSATGNVNISAQSDTSIKGANVSAEAQVGFTGKGSATAEVSASGQTTIKGGIVMIN